jgi:hypothetical protein
MWIWETIISYGKVTKDHSNHGFKFLFLARKEASKVLKCVLMQLEKVGCASTTPFQGWYGTRPPTVSLSL